SGWHLGLEDSVAGAAVSLAGMWISLWAIGVMTGENTRAGGDVAVAAAGGAWVGVQACGVFLVSAAALYMAVCAAQARYGRRWVPMAPALVAAIPLSVVV